MAKIGIDARLWGSGNTGIGRYTEELINNLKNVDLQNRYVIFCRKKDFEKIDVPGSWKKVIADIPHYSFLEQINLVQIFLKENLDLLHTPHFNVPILYPKNFVITIHDILWHKSKGTKATNLPVPLYWGKYAAYRISVKIAVKKAKKIIVPSHAVEKDVAHYFPSAKNKTVVTYEGAPKANELLVTSHKSQPYLLYVGNLYPHKNVETLARSMKHLGGIKLLIAGGRSAFEEKFTKFLKEEKLEDRVKLMGHVTDSQLAGLYQNAQAFVFPTLSEGFGLPGLEAMAYGCPVICSDIPVLKEVYGQAALYFNPHVVEDISDKISRAISNKRLQKSLIKNGFERVKKYSWQKMAQQTLNVYKEVLGK